VILEVFILLCFVDRAS